VIHETVGDEAHEGAGDVTPRSDHGSVPPAMRLSPPRRHSSSSSKRALLETYRFALARYLETA